MEAVSALDRARIRSQVTHLLLTLIMAWIVVSLTHKREALLSMISSAWMASVFTFAAGPIPLWRIAAGVAGCGILFYALCRFLF